MWTGARFANKLKFSMFVSQGSLDFIEGLPTSSKYNAILVVVDKFTKFGHVIPVRHPFNASTITQLFMDNVYKNHGRPQVIISNRDKIFISSF